jgi:mersacidin/lichenicidin family type 2 lantibiotic
MSHLDVVRAWKDENFRLSLGEANRAMLPANPAGEIELGGAGLKPTFAAFSRDNSWCTLSCSCWCLCG